jgi:hypothetical protein
MPDPTQLNPNRLRMALDHGEVVELDGDTLVLDGQESPSVVLRLAPWRARSVARVLQEWSSVSRIFHHPTRPHLDELDLSRTLELAAAVLGDDDEPMVRSPRGARVIPNRQRLAAVAVLGEREAHLSAVQRLALVDAAAWWLSEPNGGEELAYASHCELFGGGHHRTCLPRPDHSIRRARQVKRDRSSLWCRGGEI